MDFALTEEQQDLTGLIRRIFEDRSDLPHLKAIDNSDEWFDRDTWAELAKAGLLGVAVPEADGGLGFGFLEVCLLLREQGRTVTPVPLLHSLVSSHALATFGTERQRANLEAIVAGTGFGTLAMQEYGAAPEQPVATAKPDGDSFRLTGVKTNVPMAHVASIVLVPARMDDGRVGVFGVAPAGDGVTLGRQRVIGKEPQFEMTLDGAPADLLGGDPDRGGEILEWLIARTTVAYCALAGGLSDRALELTAKYTTERKQFDRAIGTFQAVGQRLADCYTDNQAIELTMLQAASKLDAGVEAPLEVATAKFWAADGGSRVVHAALHIHGGISIDVDFPIHRYFLWMKQIEATLGAATPQLARIGRVLAEEPA
jgi:alkylation response protein AidB-like acyl-CoA dehydrogenase